MDFAHWSLFCASLTGNFATMEVKAQIKALKIWYCAIDGITNKTSDCAEGIFFLSLSFILSAGICHTQQNAILECEMNWKISFSISGIFFERENWFSIIPEICRNALVRGGGKRTLCTIPKIRFTIMSLLQFDNVCVCLCVCMRDKRNDVEKKMINCSP